MALELAGILAGVRMRAVRDDGNAGVEQAAVRVVQRAERHMAVGRVGQGTAVRWAEKPGGGGDAAVAGHAENADAGAGPARGDGGDQIRHNVLL